MVSVLFVDNNNTNDNANKRKKEQIVIMFYFPCFCCSVAPSWFSGSNLVAFNKKDGGVCPVALGNRLRTLVASVLVF